MPSPCGVGSDRRPRWRTARHGAGVRRCGPLPEGTRHRRARVTPPRARVSRMRRTRATAGPLQPRGGSAGVDLGDVPGRGALLELDDLAERLVLVVEQVLAGR